MFQIEISHFETTNRDVMLSELGRTRPVTPPKIANLQIVDAMILNTGARRLPISAQRRYVYRVFISVKVCLILSEVAYATQT